jgi:ribosomal protein S18 acetylase RimI-like enzyme
VLAGMAYVIDRSPNDVVSGNHLVELQRFYVDTPWHGRGVAHALMEAVIGTSKALGGDVLWLGVWERNARAIAFYRKQGFERVGAKTFRLGADVQTDDVMCRAL